ncbi:hypothetical protein LTS18_008130, partial [Coniosporium uncinatum]
MALDTVIQSFISNGEVAKASESSRQAQGTPVSNGHDIAHKGLPHGDGVAEANGATSIEPIKAAMKTPTLNGPDSAKDLQAIKFSIVEDGFSTQRRSNGIVSPSVPEGVTDGVHNTTERLPLVETDLLIVGTGPAGASLACFLTIYGLKGMMIGAAPGCATTPRAHITNMAALECLRDLGLEEECVKQAAPNEGMLHTRWVRSMAGDEVARAYSWGNDPARK